MSHTLSTILPPANGPALMAHLAGFERRPAWLSTKIAYMF